MDRVKLGRKPTKTFMGIFRPRTTSTSSTHRLTGNKKRVMTQVTIHLIQKATFLAQSQLENQKLKVANNIKIRTLAKHIVTKNNTLKTTSTKVIIALRPNKMITIDNRPKNSKRSLLIGISGTTQTSKRQTIIGQTSKKIDTKFRPTLKEGPNARLSLENIYPRRTLLFMLKTEDTLKKISVRVGERRFRTTTLKCSKFKTLTSLEMTRPLGKTMNFQTPKGSLIARPMSL